MHSTSDEATIREMIAEWSRALEAKDVEGLTKHYTADSVLYDVCPPYKSVGGEAIRQVWAGCLPFFPDQFRSEHSDLEVHVAGDVAFVYGLHHFVPSEPGHPCGRTWMRVTIGLRRIDGAWKVLHEHVSIPMNPMDNTVWTIAAPDDLSMPDYGAACG
ncbi:MAG: nuclear transport factor 2 family protein [Planctomycetaceae bacterium]